MTSRIARMARSLLNFRYFVAISSILFFTITCIAFFLVYQDADAMREQINSDFNSQQLILARQVASQIDTILVDILAELESLKQLHTQRLEDEAFGRAMAAMLERTRSKGVIEIGVAGPDGAILKRFDVGGHEAVPSHSIPSGCMRDASTLSVLGPLEAERGDPGQVILTGMLCTTLAFDGAMEGFLFAKLDVSRTVANVTHDIRSGRTGYAWVIGETGTFVYHPEDEFIGKNAFEARKERKPYISFSKINEIMKNQMLRGEEGMGTYISGWHRGIQGEMTKLIAFTPVRSKVLSPDRSWSVAVAAPISEVASAVRRVYIHHFAAEAALIGGMFLFALLVAFYQHRISQALKERVSRQEEFLTSVLQSSVDAIIYIDNDNRIQVWNRGAELIFGYTADEMLGEGFHRLIPPDLDGEDELRRIQEKVNKNGYIRNYRAPRITKDGRRITMDLSRTLIRSKEGQPIGSVAIIKDITEEMELEQRIYNTEKLASIGILAAGVAHEINNPLAIILGFTDLLSEKFEPGSKEREDLHMIEENANHAKSIVENLLGFARLTEGLQDTIDVGQSVNTVLKIVANTLMTKKIDVSMTIPDPLPKVKGDAREFQQVIFNLINNSIAAMGNDGGKLTVSVRAEDNFVRTSVSDTGCGIPPENRPRIFDPFFTTKRVGEGTGLGLSLCYGIVKKYGGDITFTSVSAEDPLGRPSGTIFTVSMPVYRPEESKEG